MSDFNKILITIFFFYSSIHMSWTWRYDSYPKISSDRSTSTWEKTDIPNFTQLVFSWNAFRPEYGYFSFSVQVRDAITKNWYKWHEMARWGRDLNGKDLQYSLASRKRSKRNRRNIKTDNTQFNYVRLELPNNKYADAFKIKINAIGDANLDYVKKITVNSSNYSKFNSEIGSKELLKLPSVYIDGIPKQSQMVLEHHAYDKVCSPTSMAMILGYLLGKKFDSCQVAQGAFDKGLGVYGSWPFNMAHAFELADGKYFFHVERLNSFKKLYKYLSEDMPVAVSIRGPINGGAKPYLQGHFIVVVGFENKNHRRPKVICHDPAFPSNEETLVQYDLNDFLNAWEKSYRLAYIACQAPV